MALAGDVIVGSEGYSVGRIVKILSSSGSFDILFDNWADVALHLGIANVTIKVLKRKQLLDLDSLKEIINSMLERWVAQKGAHATLRMLLEALEANELLALSELLQKELMAVPSKTSKKYFRIPPQIQNLFDTQDKGAVAVVKTPDCSITCQKIEENVESCSILSFEQFLEEVSRRKRIHYDNSHVHVITNVLLNDLEEVAEAIVMWKVDIKVLILISTLSVGNDEITEKSSELGITYVLSDEMEWDDISPKFKNEMKAKLQQQLGITPSVSELKTSLCGPYLVDLINGVKLNLFKNSFPEEIRYYVGRTVLKKNVLNKDKLFQDTSGDVFLFMGIERVKLSGLVRTKSTENSSNLLNQREIRDIRFLALDNLSHFPKICQKTKESVHVVKFEDGKFYWVKSRGEMGSIRMMLESSPESLEEDDIPASVVNFETNRVPVLISDSPGMGKSILLANLGRKLNQTFPQRIVCFVELSDFINKVKGNSTIKDIDEPSTTMLLYIGQTELEKIVLSSKLNSSELEIELLLDGMDEVNSRYCDFTLKLLKFITTLPSTRMWVTTRPHLLEDLEDHLSVLGWNIQPFSEANQISFLSSFWSTRNQNLNPERLPHFAQCCLRMLKRNMKAKDQDITGIPLQCYLLGEVYEEAAMNDSLLFKCPTDYSPPPEIDSISTLYQRVIKKKLSKYKTQSYGSTKLKDSSINQMHASLALTLLFPEEVKNISDKVLYPSYEEVGELLNVGILEQSSSTTVPVFIHRTFAEFFVADFALKQMCSVSPSSNMDKAMSHLLFQVVLECRKLYNYYGSFEFINIVICYFINSLIGSEAHSLSPTLNADHCPYSSLHYIAHASANQNLENIFELIKSNSRFKEYESHLFTEDYLLNAVTNCESKFVKIVLRNFENHHKFLSDVQFKSIETAVEYGKLSTVEYLLNDKELRQSVKQEPNWGEGLIQECLYHIFDHPKDNQQRFKILDLLINIKPDLMLQYLNTYRFPSSKTVHVKVIAELTKLGLDVLQCRFENDDTFIHYKYKRYLSVKDYLELLRLIPIDKLKELVQIQNKNKLTPLETAVTYMDIPNDVFKIFKEAGADIAEINAEDGNSLFSLAIKSYRSIDTFTGLIANGADVSYRNQTSPNESLLHLAAGYGNWQVVQILIKKHSMNPNEKDANGQTPLDYFILRKKFFWGDNNLEKLIRETYDKKEYNWEDYYQTGCELWENGGRFSDIYENSHNFLFQTAILKDNFGGVKFFLDKEMISDVNLKKSNSGDTPLHLAVSSSDQNRLRTIQLLLEKGANPDTLNNNDKSPFQLFLETNSKLYDDTLSCFQLLKSVTKIPLNPEVATSLAKFLIGANQLRNEEFHSFVEECVLAGVDLNYKSTLLCAAVERRYEPTLKFLLRVGAEVNNKTSKNNSLLHDAVRSFDYEQNWNIVRILIDAGIDVYARNADTETFLHWVFWERQTLTPSQFHNIAKYLIVEKGYTNLFSILDPNSSGVSPFHYAVLKMALEEQTLELFHSSGIDFNMVDKEGDSVLSYAIFGNRAPAFLSCLIRYGGDVKHLNKKRNSLLHTAPSRQKVNAETLTFLLSKGVDPNQTNINGHTPLYEAIYDYLDDAEYKLNTLEKVKILLKAGANPDIENKNGATQLQSAIKDSQKTLMVYRQSYIHGKFLDLCEVIQEIKGTCNVDLKSILEETESD